MSASLRGDAAGRPGRPVRSRRRYFRVEVRRLPRPRGCGQGRFAAPFRNHHERDGGLYLEIEAIALSRDIPSGLGFLVEPIVRHRAREALMTTLRQTEDAVRNGPASAGGTSKGTAATLHPAR